MYTVGSRVLGLGFCSYVKAPKPQNP